jgi:6-pyruvoyltetrahydropterin/6-carboxytetrahydropterin synthase
MTLPTSENMVIDFAQRITSRLPEGICSFEIARNRIFFYGFASDNFKSIL